MVKSVVFLKFKLILFLFSLFPLFAKAQDDTVVIRLNLKQIIDSALNNHPEIKNAELKIISAKTHVKGIPDFKPTEINYERGQMFTSFKDDKIEIRQNFGSPFTWNSKAFYEKTLIDLQEMEASLIKAQITNRVKAAYYDCIYEMNRLKVLDNQKALFSNLLKQVDLHFKNYASGLLEKTIAETLIAEIISQSDQSYNDYLIAKNNLIKEAYLNSDFEPMDEDLELYEITFPIDTSNHVQINLLSNYYNQCYSLADASVKLENSKFYPEFTAGYFDQSINGTKGFTGFQVGIVAPLWFFPQSAKRKEAVLQKQIANNERDWQKFYVKNNSEKLRIELNKQFERLNYFYDFALKQADTIEDLAIKQLKADSLKHDEYIQNINKAYNIRLEYLETLNKYNQAAIELELYSYY